MIKTSEDNSLFITGFDQSKQQLSFRVSYEPNYLQVEKIAIVGDNVKTNLYYFNVAYLNKFLTENR